MSKEEVIKMAGVNKESSGKRIAIVTFGWPLVTVARDGVGDSEEDKCFRVNGLGKSKYENENRTNVA